jgi:hypothetical protein
MVELSAFFDGSIRVDGQELKRQESELFEQIGRLKMELEWLRANRLIQCQREKFALRISLAFAELSDPAGFAQLPGHGSGGNA